MKIGIIGSGIAGLAVSARLAAKGHSVYVYEAKEFYGGKMKSLSQYGFRWDKGPSLLTMPNYLDDVFLACGKDPRKYYSYEKLKTSAHYFYSDKTFFKAPASIEELSNEFQKKFQIDASAIQKRLIKIEKRYNRIGKIFTEKNIHQTKTWLSKDVLKAVPFLHTYKLFVTMNKENENDFSNKKVSQFFNRFATYNGSNPYLAPGLLNLIPYLEFGLGSFYPTGGMQVVADSLYKLCADLGVNFHFNNLVEQINIKNNCANSITVNNKMEEFDAIVCNADVAFVYQHLLKDEKLKKRTLKQERSSSALVFYWGMNVIFPQLDLHNIFFSGDYKNEFKSIFQKNSVTKDPTVYVNITSKYTKTDAPTGSENWFVMINAPANPDYFTNEKIDEIRNSILNKLSNALNVEIEKCIITESILTPKMIENDTSSYLGSIYGTSSNSRMAAFNRHGNRSKKYKNLFFCGGSVHPGGGIPLCLNSAKLVSFYF